MLILAFDTTSAMGGVAIFRDSECLAESAPWGAGSYSVDLFTGLDSVLHAARLDIRQIDLLAAARGPGSFTGIRTGLAAALGWSKACGRPARGVPVLDALVEAGAPTSARAAAILDAGRSEFYGALFRRILPDPQTGAGAPVTPRVFLPAGEPFVLRPAPLAAVLHAAAEGEGSLTCVIREHETATMELRSGVSPAIDWLTVRGPLLAAIARLARIAELEGSGISSQELDACYIRRPDAETNWKD